jgi:hypothetical protein
MPEAMTYLSVAFNFITLGGLGGLIFAAGRSTERLETARGEIDRLRVSVDSLQLEVHGWRRERGTRATDREG